MEKRGVEREVITWLIIVLVLAFVIFAIVLMQKQGFDMIEKIKNLIRFR